MATSHRALPTKGYTIESYILDRSHRVLQLFLLDQPLGPRNKASEGVKVDFFSTYLFIILMLNFCFFQCAESNSICPKTNDQIFEEIKGSYINKRSKITCISVYSILSYAKTNLIFYC